MKSVILSYIFKLLVNNKKRFVKVISKGDIKNDTIHIVLFGTKHKYVKKSYNQIFNEIYES